MKTATKLGIAKTIGNISKFIAILVVIGLWATIFVSSKPGETLRSLLITLAFTAFLLASYSKMRFVVVLGLLLYSGLMILSCILTYNLCCSMYNNTKTDLLTWTFVILVSILFTVVSVSFWLALYCRWRELALLKKLAKERAENFVECHSERSEG